jgi:hypothetical protein
MQTRAAHLFIVHSLEFDGVEFLVLKAETPESTGGSAREHANFAQSIGRTLAKFVLKTSL